MIGKFLRVDLGLLIETTIIVSRLTEVVIALSCIVLRVLLESIVIELAINLTEVILESLLIASIVASVVIVIVILLVIIVRVAMMISFIIFMIVPGHIVISWLIISTTSSIPLSSS